MYLEIVGPDPAGPRPAGPRPFFIDSLTAPRLVTWAARGENLEAIVKDAAPHGVDLGAVSTRSRQRPDGSVISWTMTDPLMDRDGGTVPFLIDWGSSPHPADGGPTGCRLLRLRAVHPDPERVRAVLRRLGLDLDVKTGDAVALVATLQTPRGSVELR
jgi:hypothetical protein